MKWSVIFTLLPASLCFAATGALPMLAVGKLALNLSVKKFAAMLCWFMLLTLGSLFSGAVLVY